MRLSVASGNARPLRVSLHADGLVGRGEAAPLEGYDGISVARVRAALTSYVPVLADDPPDPLAACALEDPLPQALAAVDLALWDLRGLREGLPVCRLLADDPLERVPVNSLGVEPGFGCVKLKLGVDVLRVRAEVGPDVLIRVDANGAWITPDKALREIEKLTLADLEYVEEPVHGVAGLAEVAVRSPVPIAMDETDEPAAGVTRVVVVKITRGGITGAWRAAEDALAAGSDVVVASTMDGEIGIAAGLHLAAALRVRRHCGLATLPSAFPAVRGFMDVPTGPGLLDGGQ